MEFCDINKTINNDNIFRLHIPLTYKVFSYEIFFYKQKNWGSVKISDLSKFTQLLSRRARDEI
jgi:hypothetical protein